MIQRLLFIFLAAMFLVSSNGMLMAQSAQTPQRLIAAGDYDAALQLLEASNASGLEVAYYRGVILYEQERYEEAVALFRRILQARPEQILVRQALVRALVAQQSYEAAEFHLDELIERDESERNIAQYRTMQRRILNDKPYGITGSFSLVPSSNINRGTTNRVFSTGIGDFTIVEESQEKAGTSVNLTVSTFRRFQLNEESTLTLTGTAKGAQVLEDGNATAALSLGFDYRRLTETGYWQLSPETNLNFIDGTKSYYSLGLDYRLQHRTSRQNIWTYSIGGSENSFFEDTFRDGVYVDSSVNLRHIINSTLSITTEVALGAGLPERKDLQYRDISVSFDVSKAWENGWRTTVGVEFNYRPYQANFTAVDYAREDHGRTLSVSFANANFSFADLSPSLGCSIKDAESNIAFYDYAVTECGIGLTRRF